VDNLRRTYLERGVGKPSRASERASRVRHEPEPEARTRAVAPRRSRQRSPMLQGQRPLRARARRHPRGSRELAGLRPPSSARRRRSASPGAPRVGNGHVHHPGTGVLRVRDGEVGAGGAASSMGLAEDGPFKDANGGRTRGRLRSHLPSQHAVGAECVRPLKEPRSRAEG